jgi:AraC-like DNA-binding protein
MDFPADGTRVMHHEDERESWSFAIRAPAPPLRGLVPGYCLYEERRTAVPLHRHLPHPAATLLIGLEGTMELVDPDGSCRTLREGEGFLAGLHTRPARTRSGPRQRGVDIKLPPPVAHRLLGGLPMQELANRDLPLDSLLGPSVRELAGRLAAARGPDGAFDLLDDFLGGRILDAPRRHSPVEAQGVAHAWRRLWRSGGRVRIGAVAADLGWSRKRLVAAFREQVGLPPKTAARILRFDAAMEMLKARPGVRWSEVALACGYADQAHLAREVRALSGSTPGGLARSLLPASGGMAA